LRSQIGSAQLFALPLPLDRERLHQIGRPERSVDSGERGQLSRAARLLLPGERQRLRKTDFEPVAVTLEED